MTQPHADTALLSIGGLNKWFGSYHALRDVDLQVAKGEKIVVCGPSGSGKSTLIRCINRIESFEEGRIALDGLGSGARGRAGQREIEEIRRQVGMVFQHFNLFPHMTVLENCILAPMRSLRETRAVAEAHARELLARVRIADQADKYPGQLSGGQQQRVAIARALCMRPRLMLFDEPTSALDPEMKAEVLDLVQELCEAGQRIVLSTHEMGFARNSADHVAFLANGELVEEGAAAALFDQPSSEVVSAFLAKVMRW